MYVITRQFLSALEIGNPLLMPNLQQSECPAMRLPFQFFGFLAKSRTIEMLGDAMPTSQYYRWRATREAATYPTADSLPS